MSTLTEPHTAENQRPQQKQRSLSNMLAPLNQIAKNSPNLMAQSLGTVTHGEETYELPRYVFVGPKGGDEPIRIGLFGAIHGDEPASGYALIQFLTLLEKHPELATGYCLFVYPVCNPTGFEDDTRLSRSGRDLNREFWQNTTEPEVQLLEKELIQHSFHGIVALHADDTSHGLYGFVRGSTLTKHLIEPALKAAEQVLPRNQNSVIDGFNAENGIIKEGYDGILSAPPRNRPKPFEIILETPHAAPQYQQEHALVVALQQILNEYRKLVAYAPNL